MPKEWTTKGQRAFLDNELIAFKRIGGRNYTKHWQPLYKRWFERWPERELVLPGCSDSATLTSDQKDVLSNAIGRRQGQLYRWMHWHSGAGEHRSANAQTARIMSDLLKPKQRVKKPWEIYSKNYYQARVQPNIGKGLSITEVNQKIQEMYENESPDIKDEIQNINDQQKKAKKRRKSYDGEEDLESNIDEDETETDPHTIRR